MMLFSWLLAVFLAMLYGCQPQRMHLRTGENPSGIGRTIANMSLPDGASGTVTGSLAPSSGAAAGPYIIHIEGFRGIATSAAPGESFTLVEVPAGERRVIVTDTGGDAAPQLRLAAARFAARSQPLTVSAGKSADAGAITLAPAGVIRGTVNGASPAGTAAFIPGTWFISEVDGSGNYTIDGVPAGDYYIDVQRPNFVKGYTALMKVSSGADVTALPVTIDTPLTPAGAIALESGAEFAESRTVRVDLSQEPAATQIMLSQDPSFQGAVYQPVVETVEYTFAADGKARLYAKFLKNGMYETSAVYDDIFVDSALPTGSIGLQNGSHYTDTRNVMLAISGSDPAGISQMMVSENENFSGASWVKFATSMPFALKNGDTDGEKTIYLKLKNALGRESEVISDAVGFDTINPGDPTIVAGTDGYTNTRQVAIKPTATSAVAPISEVMFSEQSDLADAAWASYASSMTFQVSAGEGVKTIWAKFKDAAGNESQIVHTTVILDTTPPTDPVLATTAGRIAAATTSLQIAFATESTDNAFKCYEAQGGQYAAWTEVTEPIIFQLAKVNSWYPLQVRGKDRAGNTSATVALRIYHGDRTILAASAAQLDGETSRSATSGPLTLTSAYSPYFITGNGTNPNFTDYNLTIAAGSELDIDTNMSLALTNLTVSGVSAGRVNMISAASTSAGAWRYLELSGSVALNYLNVEHNQYTWLSSNASAPQITNSLFTAFRSIGIKDESTGAASFSNISIIGTSSSGSQTGYSGIMAAGASKTFSKVLMQSCFTGMDLEGELTATMRDSSLNGNGVNIYLNEGTSGTLTLGNNFLDYTSASTPADWVPLGVTNDGGAKVMPVIPDYDPTPKGPDVGQPP